MVLVVFRRDYAQVLREKLITVSGRLKKLGVEDYVINTGVNLLEIAQPELLLFEIKQHVQVILGQRRITVSSELFD